MFFPLRRAVAACAASCLALVPVGGAFAQTCHSSPTHEAFDVQGLKSELMVTALSCNAQDRYNAFVSKFRERLLSEDTTLNAYFHNTFGARAQVSHDDYITQLANVQSEGGLRAGTIFCMQRVAMFDEVQALDDGADLAHYAEAKDVAQPASFEICSGPAVAAGTVVRSRRVVHHHTHT